MACENEDCATCSTDAYYVVEEEFTQRIIHRREIRAASAEAAIAVFQEGTAWPASYDYVFGAVVDRQPIKATPEASDRAARRAAANISGCWDSDTHKAELAAFIARGSDGIFSGSSSGEET